MIWLFKKKTATPPQWVPLPELREVTTWAVSSLEAKMIWPHYSDPRFDGQDFIVLFDDGTGYQSGGNDDDRLASWDRVADVRGICSANLSGMGKAQAGWWKAYLEAYYLGPVQLHKIIGSVSGGGGPIFTLCYEVPE
jgi:hypothetical protein